jgi:hypothetical protein
MCINQADADFLLGVLDESFSRLSSAAASN